MGDLHRYRNDANKLRHFQSVEVFLVECVLHEKVKSSLQTSARQTMFPEYRQSSTGNVEVTST